MQIPGALPDEKYLRQALRYVVVHIFPERSRLVLVGVVSCCLSMFGQSVSSTTDPKLEWYAGYSAIETNDHVFQFTDIGPAGNLDYDEKGRSIKGKSRTFFTLGRRHGSSP